MSDQLSDLAGRVHRSDSVDRVAGAGLATFGFVHLVIAWLAVQLALGAHQDSASTTGAVRALSQQPYGVVLVWLVAAGMALLAAWQASEAVIGHRDRDGVARLLFRLGSAGRAVVYAVVAAGAVRVAVGSGGGSGTDSATARLMDLPAGQVLVALVGVVVFGVGVGLLVVAWTEPYLDGLDRGARRGGTGTAYRWLGRVGHVAKGIAVGLVGVLFCYAAVTHEAKKSGGLDQALQTVLRQPFGPILLIAMGLGIACFGLFCLVQARHLDR